MPIPAVQQLDQRIVADSCFDGDFFDQFVNSQRELGLVFGERPTCPFLRPHIISRQTYDDIKSAAEIIARTFDKLVDHALENPTVMTALSPRPEEEAMARIDPGYELLCITSRLDAYVTPSGFQFLEYNAESPAGVGDQMQLEKLLFALPNTKEFLEEYEHWRPQPHYELLQSLLRTYAEWGGSKQYPQIAIVDWKGVSTEQEFRVLKQFFEAAGNLTRIVDPFDLSYDGQNLVAGDFTIDIVYKRVVIHEFLERCGVEHPLVAAYRDKRVCLVNSFRTKLAHKKAGFAILSDPSYEQLFSDEELASIRRHIPWTRRVSPERTIYEGEAHDLIGLITNHRERFVLKPNDDYGGHGVVLGWETDVASWQRAIEQALQRPYVVQERVAAERIAIPMFSDEVKLEEMFVDFNPFLFANRVEGALIRLSSSSVINITAGGGQSALVVLED